MLHHALAQPPVADLKRKSVAGGYSWRLGARCKICRTDRNNDGVGAVAITGGFWIAGNGGHGDRFRHAFNFPINAAKWFISNEPRRSVVSIPLSKVRGPLKNRRFE
jgi:hypothetical protein